MHTTFTGKQSQKPHLGERILETFFFYIYVEYDRILLSAEAKAFSTMQLQFITSIHYLLNCLFKHRKIGLNYLKIYFAFSIALS